MKTTFKFGEILTMFHRYLQISLLCLLSYFSSALLAGPVQEFTLENGLHLIVKEDHRAPIAVSQVWYKVGGAYEQEGKTGLSHMLEHMMFKGTKKYGPGEFSRIMAANGASENAFTDSDATAYFQSLEKSRLALSFELEADRMRNLVLSEAEFAKEKQVVLEERRMRTEDQPDNMAFEHFLATAYQTSPYQNPIIGWMSDIKNLTLTDLQHWYQRWYAPNNAIVVVAGDVNPTAVFELAKTHFGPLPRSEITPVPTRPEVEQYGMKRLIVKRPAKLPELTMGYKVPTLATVPKGQEWQVYALEVLAYILDGGDSARLTKNLVRAKSMATNIWSSYDFWSALSNLFIFNGKPSEKHTLSELEEAIREQITQLQTTLVDEKELTKIKNQLRASKVYEADSVFYQAMQIGRAEAIGLNWQIAEAYLDNIIKVTPAQLQQVATQYLTDDNLTVAVLEPQSLTEKTKNTTIMESPNSAKGAIH